MSRATLSETDRALLGGGGGSGGGGSAAVESQETDALASSLVLSTAACSFIDGYAQAAVDGYLMLFDAATAPADGAVAPKGVVFVPAGGSNGLSYLTPLKLLTGATLVFSTTGPFVKTAAAQAFMSGRVK